MELASIERLMASTDPQARKRAALQLAELGPDAAASRLVTLLKDDNPAVSEAAQASLSLLGGTAAIQTLIPLLSSAAAAERNAAIEVLRRVGQDDLGLVHALTRAADEHVRIFSVDILGTIASSESLETLCACLVDPQPNVRNAALVSLGQLGDVRALPQMQPLIDDEEWIRFTLLEALARIGGPTAAQFMVAQLDRWRGDELTLSAIIEGLGLIGEPASVEPLLKLLPEVDGFVGLSLVRTLAGLMGFEKLGELTAVQRLQVKTIVEDQILFEEQQSDLLEILSVVGDLQSAEVLLEMAQSLDPLSDGELGAVLCRTMAALDLGDIAVSMLDMDDGLKDLGAEVLALTGGQEEALIAALDRVSGSARRSLAAALSRSDSPVARECLKRLMSDPDGHVAALAIRAAVRWAASEDLAVLGAYLEHAYPDVRAAALDAICALDGPAAERLLLDRLATGDLQVRKLALEGLARSGSQRLTQILNDALATDPLEALRLASDFEVKLDEALIAGLLENAAAPVRQLSMELIGRQKIQGLRPQLEAVLRGSDKRSAYQAILALGRFQDDAARASLLESLRQGPDLLKIAALKAFADWADPSLVEELEPCLEDDNPDIAHACARVLEKLNGV